MADSLSKRVDTIVGKGGISPIPIKFSKDLYCRHLKTGACLGVGQPFPKQSLVFTTLGWRPFENIVVKEKRLVTSIFSFFTQFFSALSKTEITNFCSFKFCATDTFNFVVWERVKTSFDIYISIDTIVKPCNIIVQGS